MDRPTKASSEGMEDKNIQIIISIIIPVYNVQDYIIECLDSISHQDYNGQIECLLIDDCSTDNSRDLIKEYISKYIGHIHYQLLCQEKNQKQGAARNRGIKESKGNYILFVDSDDTIEKNCLNVMVSALEKYPNTDYVQCGMKENNGRITFVPYNYPQYINDKHWILQNSLYPEGGIPFGPCNRLIKKQTLVDNNIEFPANVIYEDVQFSYLLGLYSKAICFCNDITYVYRTNRDGSTITTTSKQLEYGYSSRLTIINNLLDRIVTDEKHTQCCALLSRYFLYDYITPINVIKQFTEKVTETTNKLTGNCTGIIKLISHTYFILPLSIRKKHIIHSLFTKLIKQINI